MTNKTKFLKNPYECPKCECVDIELIQIDDEKWIQAHSVIISTGASAKWLGLPSEQRLNGYGVSACAVCDGFFFKGKEVAIVGAGDTAAEEAHYLSKMCTTVHMLVRKDAMRASKVMQDRVLKKNWKFDFDLSRNKTPLKHRLIKMLEFFLKRDIGRYKNFKLI